MSLEDIRAKINDIDRRLSQLVEERMKLSEQVALNKISSGSPIYSPEREEQVLNAVEKNVNNYSEEIKTVMNAVMTLSRELQYSILLDNGKQFDIGNLIKNSKQKIVYNKVGYSGKTGSFSEAAARKMFPEADKYQGYKTFNDACLSVVRGECDVAVLPLENTTAGTVNEVYDLIPEHKLYIVKSLSDIISHNILGLKGALLSDITTVISHPQALSQCSNIIKKMRWEIIECENTAYAAEEVARRGDKTIAAIGSHLSATEHNLDILNVAINNQECNQTRFVALSNSLIKEQDADKVSIAMKLPHKAGSLAWVLFMLAGLDLNLTKIQSRPITDRPWEYLFYVDFMYRKESKALQALYQLEKELPLLILLGWYKETN